MKKLCLLLVLVLLLSGCASRQVFEGVADVYATGQALTPRKIGLTLPKDAAAPVLSGDTGILYFCDGYEIAVETLPSGNLDGTLRSLTGYGKDALTLLETFAGDTKRYECVWTSVGESCDRVGRAVILDDGSFHYCVSVMADAREAGALQESWQELLGSIVLS